MQKLQIQLFNEMTIENKENLKPKLERIEGNNQF